MLTAVHSMETLHLAGLVHGDIKPANVLIKQIGSNFSAKIIDFDNCFVSREPPPRDELVGDPAYYSPELMQYMLDGTGPHNLGVKADVFALGIVFLEYVTGSRPEMPAPYTYPADAAVVGELPTAELAARGDPVGPLIESMLAANADNRPSMKETHNALKRIRRYGKLDAPPSGGSITDGLRRVTSLGGTLWARRSTSGAPGRTAGEGADGEPTSVGVLGGTLWTRRRAGGGSAPTGVLGGTLWARRRTGGAPGGAAEDAEPAGPKGAKEGSGPPGSERRLRGSLTKKKP